jgi:3-(3-hydroxy-phenyl)propionate hydroxylase
MPAVQHTDVVIVGAGPVGLTLANLLGAEGIRTLVIERNAAVEPEPRAVTLDDESLRTFQNAGLADAVVREVVLGYGVQYFDWRGRPLAAIQPTRQEYGYPKRNAFRQPLLVRTLFEGLARFPQVAIRFGHELDAVTQETASVRCHVKREDGEVIEIEAKWLVACDGGRSKVRDLGGIPLQGSTYPERWLIVDLADRTTPLRHTRTYCDPRRPAIRLPGPRGSLRYEFMLRAGDRDEEVLDDKTFRHWIAGREPEDAGLPLARKAIYGFHARVASRWKDGRVLLAGDAAHLTPPFAGQGLNSGIRDAANLAWKLAAVVRGSADATLLDTYESERRPHAAALIRMALRIGAFMQPKTIAGAFAAQTALRLACLVPACRDYILQLKFKPKPRFAQGWFETSSEHPAAELIPQPLLETAAGGTALLDTLLACGFAVIGWDTPAFRAHAKALLPPGFSGKVLALIRREDDFLCPEPDPGIGRARDTTGELGAWLDERRAAAIVLRPDRYTCRQLAARQLTEMSLSPPTTKETNMPPEFAVRRALMLTLAASLVATGIADRAQAQPASFPTKPVRILTAFPAGSGPDAALRVVAQKLSTKWGQPVVVDNRPGGNGFVAIAAFKQGSADGHDLIQLDSNHLTTHPHTFSKLPYDPQKDLVPLRQLFRNSFFVVVSKDSPFKSLDDIVAAARAQPGKVTYGSWFTGSPGHLGALRLQRQAGIQMLHAPFKEMSQLYTSVATQEVQWALGSAASAGALEKAGKVRFVAVTGPSRSKAYPAVPSVDESTLTRSYEASAWTGLFAPRGIPAPLRDRISADVLEALKSPEVMERYRAFDYELHDVGGEVFADLIARETRNWAGVIQAANLKLD